MHNGSADLTLRVHIQVNTSLPSSSLCCSEEDYLSVQAELNSSRDTLSSGPQWGCFPQVTLRRWQGLMSGYSWTFPCDSHLSVSYVTGENTTILPLDSRCFHIITNDSVGVHHYFEYGMVFFPLLSPKKFIFVKRSFTDPMSSASGCNKNKSWQVIKLACSWQQSYDTNFI